METAAPTKRQVEELLALGAATLFHGNREAGAVDPAIKPIAIGMKLAGPAVTVDVPAGDNLVLHHAISTAAPGTVLVVDYKAHMHVAVTGDLMALAAKTRGIAGMAVDGAVRDADQIAAMGFPVFARGLSIRGPGKDAAGSVGQPVSFGGITVNDGDIVVGDTDGIVIIAKERWTETLRVSMEREQKEVAIRTALREGKTTIELLALGAALERHGLG